jgi:small subunit ribosomal protein S10
MPKTYITIKSFEWYHIKNTIAFVREIQLLLNPHSKHVFKKLNEISLPKKRKLFTVLRSPHIDKKSREQFEFTRYKKKLFVQNENVKKTALFFFILKNSEFPGVEIEISMFHNSFLTVEKKIS